MKSGEVIELSVAGYPADKPLVIGLETGVKK